MKKIKNNQIVRKSYYLIRGIVNKKVLIGRAENTLDLFKISFNNEQEKLKHL